MHTLATAVAVGTIPRLWLLVSTLQGANLDADTTADPVGAAADGVKPSSQSAEYDQIDP